MAYRTNDDGPCANCSFVSCDTCKIAASLEFTFTKPKQSRPAAVIELPTEEELEKIMHEAGYYVSCDGEDTYNATGRTARPTNREQEDIDELLAWAYELSV